MPPIELSAGINFPFENVEVAEALSILANKYGRLTASGLFGPESVKSEGEGTRTLAGEDFSAFLEQVPGCFAFVGARNESKGIVAPLHSPHFDIDEDALEIMARLHEGVARHFLGSS